MGRCSSGLWVAETVAYINSINPWWKLSLVFKCLTDTIMLDDFKTELKRLGIKRLRHDELRRQSVALVLDHETKDDDDDTQLEFSDALNVNPARFQTLRSLDNSSTQSPTGRPRPDSMHHANGSKDYIGRSAKKISQLPGLKDFSFGSSKKNKKAKADDEEKQKPQDTELSPPPPPDRLSEMRQSLGVIDLDRMGHR
jgi:hypothetical protein